MTRILIHATPAKADFVLCNLNPTARGRLNKWQPRLYVELLDTELTKDKVQEILVQQGRATAREFRREQVRLYAMGTEWSEEGALAA